MNLECPFHEFNLPEEGGECPECGFVVETAPGAKQHYRRVGEPKGIYDSYEDAYEELAEDDLASSIYAEEYQRDLARETYSHIGTVSGLEVAELGVGQGFLQRHFLADRPKSLLALDIAEEYVRNARQIYERSGNEATSFLTSVGNVEFMPYRESFDVVVATDILEHVLNLGNALSRISRMLKPNGRFWCRVPNEEVLGQYSIYNGQKYEFAHLRFFDESSLCAQLKEAGFGSFSCNKFGFQAHRLKLGMPSLMSRVLGKLFALSGFYGSEVHHFNRKMRNSLQWPVRILHQPLEILVGATKK